MTKNVNYAGWFYSKEQYSKQKAQQKFTAVYLLVFMPLFVPPSKYLLFANGNPMQQLPFSNYSLSKQKVIHVVFQL